MSQIKNKTTLNLILLFSIFALTIAYFVEYVLGHKPCNLCLIERLPYVLAIIIISLGLILKKFEKTIIIFEESLFCKLDKNITNLSKDELLKELQKETISCKDVSFRIFGFSLATINTIISLILSVINIKLFLNYEKNK